MTGFVADVGGTNTRLARVDASGVIADTIATRANSDFSSFEELACDYLSGQDTPSRAVIAVAGPVGGERAELTNRAWSFETGAIARRLGASSAHLINDLEALGYAVAASVPSESVEPLHAGAVAGTKGQALVVGLGTGFNVSPVDLGTGAVFAVEYGHAGLPAPVLAYLETRLPDVSAFETVEHVFSGVGMLRLARVLGLDVTSAAEIPLSTDPKAALAIDICTEALAILVREMAYIYYPRAGFYFNGSLARMLLAPDRRERVLAPLRKDKQFEGQLSKLPAFLFVSDTIALGGCAARLLSLQTR